MNALLQPFAAVASLVFTAAFFGPAHRLLPAKVRYLSPGFISVLVAFFVASLVRHAGFTDQTVATAFIAAIFWLLPLALLLGTRGSSVFTLALAVSAGVDFTASGLALFGLDIARSTERGLLFAWEIVAVLVAFVRLELQRQRSGNL